MDKHRSEPKEIIIIPPPELFYRYVNYSNHLKLYIFKFKRETKCGYWIDDNRNYCFGGEKWVSKTSKKRYAYPTEKEALISFIARKERQIKIISNQIADSKITLRHAMQRLGIDTSLIPIPVEIKTSLIYNI